MTITGSATAAPGPPGRFGPGGSADRPLAWDITGLPGDLAKAIEFHGHLCSGLVKGYKALKFAQEKLQSGKHKGAKLMVVVENQKCGLDAIQRLSGSNSPFANTAGNGMKGLVVMDYGKDTWIFIREIDRKTYRLSLVPKVLDPILHAPDDDRFHALKMGFMMGMSSLEKQKEFMKLMNKKALEIIDLDYNKMFNIRELSRSEYNELQEQIPPIASRLPKRFICAVCGETVVNYYGRFADGKAMCIPCYRKHQKNKKD